MSIFTLERRESILVKMLEVGLELIREKSMQQITISEVTKRTGIGKGTFYHFFASKEEYLAEVIHYSKDQIYRAFNAVIERDGGFTRQGLETIFEEFSPASEKNIIVSLRTEDVEWLNQRLEEKGISSFKDVQKENQVIEAVLSQCDSIRKDMNPLVLANMMKIIALAVEKRSLLHEEALKENIRLLEQQVIDYLFGKEEM